MGHARLVGYATTLALAVSLIQAPGHAEQKIGAWTYKTTKDAMTDAVSPEVSVTAADDKGLLTYYCQNGKSFGYFMFTSTEYLGETDRWQYREIKLRVDKSEPIDYKWSYGDYSAFSKFRENADMLKKQLTGGSKLLVRAYTYRDYPVDAEFDISGSEAAFARVDADC